MESIGYFFLAIVALVWIGLLFIGIVAALPYGLIGFAVILGIGFLFAKVVKDRVENKEDDHYSNNVDQ